MHHGPRLAQSARLLMGDNDGLVPAEQALAIGGIRGGQFVARRWTIGLGS